VRLPDIIESHRDSIVESWLVEVKKDADISRVRISDSERKDHIPYLLTQAVFMMRGQQITDEQRKSAQMHGESRARQAYKISLILREARILRKVLGMFIQEHLLNIVVSHFVSDMARLYDTIDELLEESVQAFLLRKRANTRS